MNFRGRRLGRCCCLLILLAAGGVESYGRPQDQEQSRVGSQEGVTIDANRKVADSSESKGQSELVDPYLPADHITETKLGLPLLKNLARDQRAIWTSPKGLRYGD